MRYFMERTDPGHQPVVSFYGGEPLLEMDLLEQVVLVGRQLPRGGEIRFVIDTNGTNLDEAARDLVVREKIHLQVSLDGPEPFHDLHRVNGPRHGLPRPGHEEYFRPVEAGPGSGPAPELRGDPGPAHRPFRRGRFLCRVPALRGAGPGRHPSPDGEHGQPGGTGLGGHSRRFRGPEQPGAAGRPAVCGGGEGKAGGGP